MSKCGRFLLPVFGFLLQVLLSPLPCHASEALGASGKLGPSLRLLAASRTMLPELADGALPVQAAQDACRVTIGFDKELSPSDIALLEVEGVEFERYGGSLCRVGTVYAASVPWALLEQLELRPEVLGVESVWHPKRIPPLDLSAPEIQAPETWEQVDGLGEHLTGKGMVIADFDTGVDVFHPHFWRADGDTLQWLDVNSNDTFDPGVDGVDLNSNSSFDAGETLRFFDGEIYDPAGTFGGGGISNNDGVFQSNWDWLYNDANGNGIRDYGRSAGFDESSPTYGELMFVLMDADSDLAVDPGEELVALNSCKIIATLGSGTVERVRGVDLIDTEADSHGQGTAVSGILVGGVRGLSRFCGIAPDAEIIVGNFFSDVSLATLLTWATARGADVVLYEGAGFVFEPLDGSTSGELLLDAAADSILQVTPAGNLCRGYKHAQLSLAPSGSEDLTFTAPATYGGTSLRYIWETLLWRTPSHDVTFSLTTPELLSATLLGDGSYQNIGTYQVYSLRTTSPRGTAEFDIQIYRNAGVGGDWTLNVQSSSGSEEEVNTYIADNASSWAGGVEFTNFRSTDKTVCWPATADSAFTLASYSTRGYEGYSGTGGGSIHPGALSAFSSRGKRVDGVSIMEIASPGNYDVYTSRSQYPSGSSLGAYRQFSGTSAAGPHVAACAAIVLQASPGFMPFEVKERITTSAARDTFTGPNYNDSWGYGKIRILDAVAPAIFVAEQTVPVSPGPSALRQNFPNPFNPLTRVVYVLPSVESTREYAIRVFDARGRLAKTLKKGTWGPAPIQETADWDGTDERGRPVSSGVYFIRLEAEELSSSVKAVLLR
ncbi:MAG: S8 family peptidase [Candidatus Eiseniibacteriota bacterium]|nr:MAG: S8 family peptidase [Candidatus Eisenbacteria bacterium]